jgi:cell wall-associated NlpC family hydrolase
MESQGVVLTNIANVYKEPDTTVELVTQAIVGTTLTIEESSEGWQYVRLPDRYHGWIEACHVRQYAPDEPPYASSGPVAEIQSLLAFLHRQPDDTTPAPALQVPIGARLEVAEEREERVRVVLPEGRALWMRRSDVVILEANSPRPRGSVQQVLETAKRFLGLPYMWGGNTPLGIDCSGFVQLAYHLHGVLLLRDSSIQYTQPGLLPVKREELEPGDLVFFGRKAITHVGMVLGNGEFIHATTHLRSVVQISRLDEAHWTELYWGARRP